VEEKFGHGGRLTLRLHATRAAARYLESYTSARSPRA
jgi:hypothetical protein